MEIRGEKLDEESDLVRPLFIINDMVSPTVSFRANDIHKVYHMLQTALEQAGIGEDSPALRRVLENGRSFFVSPKESDVICEELSSLLAETVSIVAGI